MLYVANPDVMAGVAVKSIGNCTYIGHHIDVIISTSLLTNMFVFKYQRFNIH